VNPQKYPKYKCKSINYTDGLRIRTVLESVIGSLCNSISLPGPATVLAKKHHDLAMSSHTLV